MLSDAMVGGFFGSWAGLFTAALINMVLVRRENVKKTATLLAAQERHVERLQAQFVAAQMANGNPVRGEA
jgi:uncharacterized membrane protein